MITIHLNKLLFHSFHGVHEEETIVGGHYEVNAYVCYHPSVKVIAALEETVNYVELYEIVKNRMKQPTPLLETLAMEISEAFLAHFSIIEEVNVSVKKLYLPVKNFEGSVIVGYHKKRKEN